MHAQFFKLSTICQILAIIGVTTLSAANDDLTIAIPPTPADNFVKAEFYLHPTPGVEHYRGIYLKLSGWNSNGSHLIRDSRLQKFCQEFDLALVSATLISQKVEGVDRRVYHYAAAQNGSGAALENALGQFAELSGHPELATAPLLIQGFSAGGQFAYGMACFRPERVIAFSASKGGYYVSDPTEATYQLPGLIISGENDAPRRRQALEALFRTHRAQRAPWIFVEEPNTGHTTGRGPEVVSDFFREVLPLRLPAEGSGLKPLSPEDGIHVNLTTGQAVELGAGDPIEIEKTGWLPGAKTLETWKKVTGVPAVEPEPTAASNAGAADAS